MPKPIVGIDLGGTNMQIGVVEDDRKIIGQSKRKTKPDDGLDAVLDRLAQGVREACDEAKLTLKDIAAVGIGAPGAVEPERGIVLEAVNLRWTKVDLASLLGQRVGVPVIVDNDVNVAVWGENRLGAGKNAEHLLGVWVGTGIGGGLILNGKLYYGPCLTAGEIGHVVLFPGAAPGNRSLEHNTSRTSVVDRLTRLIRSNRKSVLVELSEGDITNLKSKAIGKAYEMGDELTVEVVDNAADLLGIAISNVVTLLSLDRVVLGGGLTEAIGKPFVERVQKSARKFAFPDKCKSVQVVASALEDNAGVYGAALIARDRLR